MVSTNNRSEGHKKLCEELTLEFVGCPSRLPKMVRLSIDVPIFGFSSFKRGLYCERLGTNVNLIKRNLLSCCGERRIGTGKRPTKNGR
jgi:hypothetical protein